VGATGYEVYIRSFADSDGDGIGDLRGITDRLDYLAWLGVDAVWITPFYPSPGFDHGYDVSDYTGVDPIHGDLADFDDLVARAHALELRVVIDIVPNHSSSLHPWFVEALEGSGSPYRDFYIWRDPRPDGGPPNNWVSHFGGPAWTRDAASGQYYCHLFLPEQPDLNWENERLREHFDDILRFWCDRGVDGFRIDVASGLYKDREFRDNPPLRPVRTGMSNWAVFDSFEHRYDMDQDRTVEIYRRWNKVVAPYGAMLIGEIGLWDNPGRIARYATGGEGLHGAFFLQLGRMGWTPDALVTVARAMHAREPNRMSWVLDNHDQSRSATRFGGGEVGAARSLALTTLLFGLGGVPFLYQGQELGIENGAVHPNDVADPIAILNEGTVGRDGTRTAMPWGPGRGNGFTTGHPWLPARPRQASETVQGQKSNPSSWLNRHRDLLAVRRSHPDLWQTPAVWHDTGRDDVAVVGRGRTCVVANLSPERVTVDLPEGEWTVTFVSSGEPALRDVRRVEMPAESTLILADT